MTLVSATGRTVDRATDPTAVVAASRRAGEEWFCFEQPDRDRSAVAALGRVRSLQASGAAPLRRGRQALARARGADAIADAPTGPPGSGLVAVGGFAFAPDGGDSPRWQGFAPASLVVPEVSLARRAAISVR